MYAQETRGILVVAEPQYLKAESRPEESLYVFAYTITIANRGSVPVQLLARHWVVTDGRGEVREVKGEGVVGQQPLIPPGEAFQYSSFSTVPTPTGNMRGSYEMKVTDSGEYFQVRVPLFFFRSDSPVVH